MIIKVDVTQKHISSGTSGAATDCPVALALKDHPAIKNKWGASVTRDQIRLYRYDFHNSKIIPAPSQVNEFVGRFDRGASVEPFTFELEIP